MDENAIKAAVLTRIRRRAGGRRRPVVTSEFSLNGTGIRADLAVLDGDLFYGVEIKSAADTLKRLQSQLEGYARYFDRSDLVVAPRHLRGLREIDVHGAEIWRQEVLTDWTLHAAGETRHITGQQLLHLLPAEDRRRAIEAIGTDGENGDVDELRGAFFASFRKRYGSTSDAFWSAVAGRRIAGDDVRSLSRFRAEREQRREVRIENARRMSDWLTSIGGSSEAV